MENLVVDESTVRGKTVEELKFDQVEKIQLIRKRIDGLAFIVSSHEISPTPSMEKINAHVNLIIAKSWLQEALEYLGEEPINKGEIHTVHDIKDDTDVSDPLKVQVRKMEVNKAPVLMDANEIESLNHVRTDIDNILSMVSEISVIEENVYSTFIYQHLKEAKFWMERQLFFLKRENKRKHFEHANPGIKSQLKRPDGNKKPMPLLINRPKVEVSKEVDVKELEVEKLEDVINENQVKIETEEQSEQSEISEDIGKVIQMNIPEQEEEHKEVELKDETNN
jgi:hypothetical protein